MSVGEDTCEGGARLDDGVMAKASVAYDDGVDGIFCLTMMMPYRPPAVFARAAMVLRTRWDINRMVLKGLANLWDNGGRIGELGRRAIGYWGWIRARSGIMVVTVHHHSPLCARVNN